MGESEDTKEEIFWKNKIKQHWKVLAVVIAAGILIITGLIVVGIWFIESSPIGSFGSATLGQWSLDMIVAFAILLFLWELLIVGVPTCLFFGVGGYLWWRRLPEEEKQEIKERDKKEKSRKAQKYGGGGGGFGIFMFIAYCIYIAVDGNYNTPLMNKPYTYWLYSYMLTFMWIIIVFGIPAAIILIIVYFKVWRKK